jgi:hypothetical protein
LAGATSEGDRAVQVHPRDVEAGSGPPPVRLSTHGLLALAADSAGDFVAAISICRAFGGNVQVAGGTPGGLDDPAGCLILDVRLPRTNGLYLQGILA